MIKKVKKNRVFKVAEICELLQIDVPVEYTDIKDDYVTDTVLMDKLETKNKIISSVVEHEDFSEKYYEKLNKKALIFKTKYNDKKENVNHTDSQLLQFFIEFLYVFNPLGFTSSEYFSCELFDLTLEQTKKSIIKAYKSVRVYTVSEICKLLKIDVPDEYIDIKDNYVTDTYLIDKLETSEQIIKKVKHRKDFDEKHYNLLYNGVEKFLKLYWNNALEFIERTNSQLLQLFIQYLYVFRPLKYFCSDYFNLELHNRTVAEADTFMGKWYLLRTAPDALNAQFYRKYFKNKVIFNQVFKKFIKRKWLYARTATLDEFTKFVNETPKFIGKPIDETQGIRIRTFEFNNNALELYNECYEENMIIEEIVKNTASINEFNDSSLNTIRICTLLTTENEPLITLSAIRIGRRGEIVDNFHAAGIYALVDNDTGIISTQAVNEYHKFYDKHPDSSKQIKGFQIPQWDKIRTFTKELALVVPQMRSIGWDIGITADDKIEVIEGNYLVGLDIMQVPDQIGKKHLYDKYIKEA